MNGANIAAIVVTHQSAATIDDCLSRLRDARDVAAIRVVDNASDDGTLSIVQRHAAADTRLRFIANPDNPGFAVACNQGAHSLEADSSNGGGCDAAWLAFVNPDCLVAQDSLSRLHAHAKELGDALLGGDLVDEAGVRDVAARRCDPDFRAMLRAPARARLGVAVDPSRTVQPVDAVSGALMLLPRALFVRIGGFDESYRLHAEDLDLCRRVRDAGAVVAVANDVRVVHVRGVSSRARPWFVEWHKHRGLARYFRKFEAAQRNALVRGLVFTLIWLRFPFAVLRAGLRSS